MTSPGGSEIECLPWELGLGGCGFEPGLHPSSDWLLISLLISETLHIVINNY